LSCPRSATIEKCKDYISTFSRTIYAGFRLHIFIQRTNNRPTPFVQDMSVYHGSADILVTKQLLDGSNVVSIFQQMSCEAMSKRMATDWFIDSGIYAFSIKVLNIRNIANFFSYIGYIGKIDEKILYFPVSI
jgi:hypothetical protein